jgi:hypothetical protein
MIYSETNFSPLSEPPTFCTAAGCGLEEPRWEVLSAQICPRVIFTCLDHLRISCEDTVQHRRRGHASGASSVAQPKQFFVAGTNKFPERWKKVLQSKNNIHTEK